MTNSITTKLIDALNAAKAAKEFDLATTITSAVGPKGIQRKLGEQVLDQAGITRGKKSALYDFALAFMTMPVEAPKVMTAVKAAKEQDPTITSSAYQLGLGALRRMLDGTKTNDAVKAQVAEAKRRSEQDAAKARIRQACDTINAQAAFLGLDAKDKAKLLKAVEAISGAVAD